MPQFCLVPYAPLPFLGPRPLPVALMESLQPPRPGLPCSMRERAATDFLYARVGLAAPLLRASLGPSHVPTPLRAGLAAMPSVLSKALPAPCSSHLLLGSVLFCVHLLTSRKFPGPGPPALGLLAPALVAVLDGTDVNVSPITEPHHRPTG